MSTFILGRNVILAQLANVGVAETDLNAMSPADKVNALRAVASGVYSATMTQLFPFQIDYHTSYVTWVAKATELTEIQIAAARGLPASSVPVGG